MSESRSHLAQTHAFSAFISYSHADSKRVRKLHSQIESYRFPKGVRPIHPRNAKSGSVGRVFRDRSDLSASESLSDAITDALDRSEALIVVCSPSSRDSRWVTQEVSYFREHRPGKPILAAVLDGVPSDVFPECLTTLNSEPLAADLRSEGDGWRLGLLKLVSGITGVPLDNLVQRDSQREIRRVMAVTGVFALIALAMGVMTTVALQARNEAQFQRDEAEGLVGYMMEDLRTKLRGVGRLDIMEGVNERALAYYAKQGDQSDLSPGSLEQRAAILNAQGEDFERAGNLEAALVKSTEAHRDTGELLAREPNNPDRIFGHAQSEFWVGFYARGRDMRAQELHWRGYVDLAERLSSLEPEASRSERELGFSYGNMCELRSSQGRLDEALELCRKSIRHMKRSVRLAENKAAKAASIKALANRHGWMADTMMRERRFTEALAERQTEAALLDQLITDEPKDLDFRLRRTWADIGIGDILLAQGNPQAVPATLENALAQLAALDSRDFKNGEISLIRLRVLLLNATAKRAVGQDWGEDLEVARHVREKSSGGDFYTEMSELIEKFESRGARNEAIDY